MSFATWNFVKIYARLRETYLRAHPEKRLIPEYPKAPSPPVDRKRAPIISFTPQFEKKIGIGLVALVVVALALSDR